MRPDTGRQDTGGTRGLLRRWRKYNNNKNRKLPTYEPGGGNSEWAPRCPRYGHGWLLRNEARHEGYCGHDDCRGWYSDLEIELGPSVAATGNSLAPTVNALASYYREVYAGYAGVERSVAPRLSGLSSWIPSTRAVGEPSRVRDPDEVEIRFRSYPALGYSRPGVPAGPSWSDTLPPVVQNEVRPEPVVLPEPVPDDSLLDMDAGPRTTEDPGPEEDATAIRFSLLDL